MINKEIEFRDLGFLDLPYYAASDGHIYDREYNMTNEFSRGWGGKYKGVSLFGQKYAVHHLIGWAFPEIVGEYESGLEIDHLNTDPSDNRPENLKWRTHEENMHNPITWERTHSEEHKQKKSDSQKKAWVDPNSKLGSAEHQRRLSEAKKKLWEDPEYRQKQSDSHKSTWEDTELRQKASETQKKRWEDTEQRQKQSEASKRQWEDPEYRQKQSKAHKKKPIVQLTLKGEFIREWDSAKDASDELGIIQGSIGLCCKGKRNHAGGFKWVYYDVFY